MSIKNNKRKDAVMKAEKLKTTPLRFPNKKKKSISTQFGSLCWRRKDKKIQILLVTSRGTGRWLVPKGWPIPDQAPADAAAIEAYEEAGVSGIVGEQCVGLYSYTKAEEDDEPDIPCVVALFPIEVTKKHSNYPEKGERRRKWMSPKKAAKLVEEPELRQILKSFEPA